MAVDLSNRLCGGKISFSHIASELAERKSSPILPIYIFESGLDYILSHFQEPRFPRTISTKGNKQNLVYSREEALARFRQANLLDCKINAYPNYIGFGVINRQAPNFIFIDLDLGAFRSRLALDRALAKTLKKISEKFKIEACPSVIWSGNGYHIYLPVDASILEEESEFARFGQPSRKFIQFAEPHLSNNKSDPEHTKGLSFRNCMIRIPGSFNSKNGKREEVKIIQKWDGNRPSIKPLLFRFDLYLHVLKSQKLHHKPKIGKDRMIVYSTNWRNKRRP